MKGIYKFTNKINNKVYIGQSQNLEERYKAHKRNQMKMNLSSYNTKFYRALRKQGFENFDYEILEFSDSFSKEDLDEKEINYIKEQNSQANGYNIQEGGGLSAVPRKLSKEDIAEIKTLLLNRDIPFKEIANKYQIEESMVSLINWGKAWSNIGENIFPIRDVSIQLNKGENNPNAKFSNKEIISIRLRFVNETLDEIYKDQKDKCSFSEMKKICYGVQFKNLPIYKKRKKKWILNGTCIDYPRIEEY